MTSVTFPFFVGLPDSERKIPLLDAEFRFTTKSARQLERSAGSNLYWLLGAGRSVEALVLLVCYGLTCQKHTRNGKPVDMTEDLAVDLIDEFIDAGGDTRTLSDALYKALNDSGVYGKRKDEAEGEADPLAQMAAQPAV